MARFISDLPFRQRFLFVFSFGAGLLIWICSATNLLSRDFMNILILFYSLGIPCSLLASSTIMDLDDNKIFLTWLIFATILLFISLSASTSDKFLIHRTARFD